MTIDGSGESDPSGADVFPTALPARPAEAHALDVARTVIDQAAGGLREHSAGGLRDHSAGGLRDHSAGGLRDHSAGGLRDHSAGGLRDHSAGGLRVVSTTVGRGQAARAIATERPDAAVTLWFLDLFPLTAAAAEAPFPPGVEAVCLPDMPAGPYDLAIVPLSKGGEAELSRDLLQQALRHLRIGGLLVASIDTARDNWLREQLAATGERVRVRPAADHDAVAYIVEKTRPPARQRDFTCRFVFRDRDRLLTAITRPGVFAHRRIDPGARHLLNAVDLAPDTRVVEIGCGSGCVSLGLASRDATVQVHSLDSAARAVACTSEAAAVNGLGNVTVALDCEGRVPEPGSYDLALANPPYYGDFRIAERFVAAAHAALAPGGTLLVVTKQPSWYVEHLPLAWRDVAREEVKHYHIFEAVRP